MIFGTFTFPLRPTVLRVEMRRALKELLPDGDTVTRVTVQDLGARARVVSGQAVFRGANAWEQFRTLAGLMQQAATLTVPEIGQWQARLSELVYQGRGGEEDVCFDFTFVEVL